MSDIERLQWRRIPPPTPPDVGGEYLEVVKHEEFTTIFKGVDSGCYYRMTVTWARAVVWHADSQP